MKNIAVIIRVFSRVEDTKALVSIIRKYWTQNNYTLFIAHNGLESGYVLDDSLREYAEIIEIKENSGHRTGARDLVQKAYQHIEKRKDFDYILFIESDFWLFDEKLIQKAIESDKDIASTIWVEKRKSLAVDFFLVKSTFIAKHQEILNWDASPETDMGIACREAKASIHIFPELRPTHAPSLLRASFKNCFESTHYEGGRFRLFPRAKVVSHHVEDLPEGMKTKKSLANALINERFFEEDLYSLSFKDLYIQKIAGLFPNSGWFKK